MRNPRLSSFIGTALALAAAVALFVFTARRHDRERGMAVAPTPRSLLRLAVAPTSLADTSSGPAESPALEKEPDALDTMYAARKLIRTGSLEIEVERYGEAADRAATIAAAHGGYLADAKAVREGGGRRRGTLTLRVDAARFAEAFRQLEALGRVDASTVETQDVTKAYADLALRIGVKRDAQARLREILRTQTGRLADLVEAERELSRLVEEGEQLEGERRYLDRQTALSTITLTLFEPAVFLRDGALAPLAEALRDALPLLARSASAMLYAAAAALPWAVVALLVWRLRRRSRIRRLIRVAGAEG